MADALEEKREDGGGAAVENGSEADGKRKKALIATLLAGIGCFMILILVVVVVGGYFVLKRGGHLLPRVERHSERGGGAPTSTTATTSSTGDLGGFMPFTEFVDHLDLTKNTSLSVKTFWSGAVGKTVRWGGKLVDAKMGRGKAEVLAVNDARPSYRGYNMVVVFYSDFDKLEKLRKGDSFVFEGVVYNYKGRSGHPVIVYVKNARILDR